MKQTDFETKVRIFCLCGFIFSAVLMFGVNPKAQEKPKDIAVKPATTDVPFSASDAVEINKLRVESEEASGKMWAIIKSYGDEGEVLRDAHGNYIAIRKVEKKP